MKNIESQEELCLEVAEIIEEDLLRVLPIPNGFANPFLEVNHNCIYLAGYIDGVKVQVSHELWDSEHGADGLSDCISDAVDGNEEKHEKIWSKVKDLLEFMS
jgi:hypothetical protein